MYYISELILCQVNLCSLLILVVFSFGGKGDHSSRSILKPGLWLGVKEMLLKVADCGGGGVDYEVGVVGRFDESSRTGDSGVGGLEAPDVEDFSESVFTVVAFGYGYSAASPYCRLAEIRRVQRIDQDRGDDGGCRYSDYCDDSALFCHGVSIRGFPFNFANGVPAQYSLHSSIMLVSNQSSSAGRF